MRKCLFFHHSLGVVVRLLRKLGLRQYGVLLNVLWYLILRTALWVLDFLKLVLRQSVRNLKVCLLLLLLNHGLKFGFAASPKYAH